MSHSQDQSNDKDFPFRPKGFDNASIPQHLEKIILSKKAVKNLEEELCDRLKTENEIRKVKRSGRKCPFEESGHCSNLRIRCGERQQYATPESNPDRKRPHLCNYNLSVAKQDFRILVVDDDPLVREFCSDLLCTLGFPQENLDYAGSVAEAEDKLKRSKILNRPFHLVLIDVRMPGPSGYHLVNHLVERNFNSRQLLMSGYAETSEKPPCYMGQVEIIPGSRVVRHFLKKPIPYSEISGQIREIEMELSGR